MPLQLISQSQRRVTPREAQILDLAHLQTRDIAAQLGIAPETVKTHLKRAYLKLGAETRTAAALLWQERKAA